MTRVLPYLLGALIGTLLLYAVLPTSEEPRQFPGVPLSVVTQRQMAAVAPDAERTIGERITTQRVEPVEVAVAPDPDNAQAARFVELYMQTSVRPDTAPRLALPVVGELVLFQYASRLDEQLEIYTVGSDRTVRRHVFDATCRPIETLIDGADVIVQAGRWCWLETALGAAGVGALGYGLGSQQWEFIAGGALSLALRKLIF